jgi:uncharacterized membrane protein
MSKMLKLAFIISIILNVLFVGLLLSELPRRLGRGFSPRERMDRVLQELPEPGRSQLREKMKQIRAEAEPLFSEIQDARTSAIRILGSEPFDEAAYDRQVNKIVDLRVQMTKRMGTAVKDTAKSLPPDQREMLAKVLSRPPRAR